MQQQPPKDWAGKLVLFWIRESGGSARAPVALQDPQMETYYGDRFLIGFVPPHEENWASGLRATVRWDEVVYFLAFDSLAEYQDYMREDSTFWELSKAKEGAGPPS